MSIKEGEEKMLSGAKKEKKELTEQEIVQLRKAQQKNAAMELANYKKRLRESVEISELQVKELRYKIEYYELKSKWLDLQPNIETLEQQEAKFIAEQQKKQEEAQNKSQQAEKKPNIVLPKQGKPRSK